MHSLPNAAVNTQNKAVLLLKDKKYLQSIIGILSGRKQIVFDINHQRMRISTTNIPHIFIKLPTDLYAISHPVEFTISTDDLLPSLGKTDGSVVLLDASFKLISDPNKTPENLYNTLIAALSDIGDSQTSSDTKIEGILEDANFIDIPFNNPLETSYIHGEYFSTRVFIDKNTFVERGAMRNMLRGKVRYSCEGGKLVIRKSDEGGEEEIVADADFLDEGNLDFTCSNEWASSLVNCIGMVNIILLAFSENILNATVSLSKYKDGQIEIQVGKSIC
ncbi:hypothetical protein ENBRE01_2880 [Enteropsectra breve]|nr:hypothetical protein ENBRE01_2880 [Enteropsectra breve]